MSKPEKSHGKNGINRLLSRKEKPHKEKERASNGQHKENGSGSTHQHQPGSSSRDKVKSTSPRLPSSHSPNTPPQTPTLTITPDIPSALLPTSLPIQAFAAPEDAASVAAAPAIVPVPDTGTPCIGLLTAPASPLLLQAISSPQQTSAVNMSSSSTQRISPASSIAAKREKRRSISSLSSISLAFQEPIRRPPSRSSISSSFSTFFFPSTSSCAKEPIKASSSSFFSSRYPQQQSHGETNKHSAPRDANENGGGGGSSSSKRSSIKRQEQKSTSSGKASPRLFAVDVNGIVNASTANTSDFYILQPRQTGGHLFGLFGDHEERAPVKDEDKKIKELSRRLAKTGITNFNEPDIEYVLNATYAKGDPEKAFDLLVLLEESKEGIVKEYDPDVRMLGAVNRHGVTCYLDSILFAMFARLESFEAMLYKTFDDDPRKKLATLLRLWVNTLRVGKLITTDITKQIQGAIADCGWEEAADRCQQDASEAFSFITEKLELPMLTLKMDIFHTGKEEAEDDHKFVSERLLEVAIPEEPQDGSPITLEACLETYFNSRIEVKRYLERRATMGSMRPRISFDASKGHAVHVELVEVDGSQPGTPLSTNSTASASPHPLPLQMSRAALTRAPSIIQEHYLNEKAEEHELLSASPIDRSTGTISSRTRAGSLRKEVMMPAWQFFSLIPWYTDAAPKTDAQVAAHFSSKRPVLGICLKRYSILPDGQAIRRSTHIDIPLEIGLPHFIHDDTMAEDGAAFGNFKLSLQSIVCHRGDSVDSGHYISMVRGQAPSINGSKRQRSGSRNPTKKSRSRSRRRPESTDRRPSAQLSSEPSWKPEADKTEAEDAWLLFDDIAEPRIRTINVEQVLRDESPYLLFYQVQPIEGDPGNIEGTTITARSSGETKDSGVALEATPASSSELSHSDIKDQPALAAMASANFTSNTLSTIPSGDTQGSTPYGPGLTIDTSSVPSLPPIEISQPSNYDNAVENTTAGEPSNAYESIPKTSQDQTQPPRERQQSIASSRSQPQSLSIEDPLDDTKSAPPSRRNSKSSHLSQSQPQAQQQITIQVPPAIPRNRSRPNSKTRENRLSASFTRLAGRLAKDKSEVAVVALDQDSHHLNPNTLSDAHVNGNGNANGDVMVGLPRKSAELNRREREREREKEREKEKEERRGRSRDDKGRESKSLHRKSMVLAASAAEGFAQAGAGAKGRDGKERGKKPDRECSVM
ncbi:hypothetical protein MMC25_000587 [Agyrium rufum]|nr:hypothetical protein [Agyrium rufum]